MGKQQIDKTIVKKRLIKVINNMPEDQQIELLRLLQWQPEEQRKYPRRSYFMDVDYAIHDRAYKDFIQNIGAGGMFIETSESFSTGEKISMVFSISSLKRPLKIIGEIVWIGPQGMGVKFKPPIQNSVEKQNKPKNNL